MMIHSLDRTFVYVDPTQKYVDNAVEGDGSTPTTPLWDFPSTFIEGAIYLVRRSANGYYAEIPENSTSDISSLIIWGMPKQNEEHWDDIPLVAQNAWVDTNITGAYICFKGRNQHTLTLTACKNIYLYNFIFMDDHTDSRYDHYCINAGSSFGTNLHCKNVYFRNITDWVNDSSHPIPNNYSGSKWITLDGDTMSHSVVIENCRCDVYGSDGGPHFRLQWCEYIDIHNCVINMPQYRDSSSIFEWSEYSNGSMYRAPIVSISDCTTNIYYNNNVESSLRRTFAGMCCYANVKNISITS